MLLLLATAALQTLDAKQPVIPYIPYDAPNLSMLQLLVLQRLLAFTAPTQSSYQLTRHISSLQSLASSASYTPRCIQAFWNVSAFFYCSAACLQITLSRNPQPTSFPKLPLPLTMIQGLPGILLAQVLLWKPLTFPSCYWTM